MPGDDRLPDADLVIDRRLVLEATPDVVWPWLDQLGKRRAGWYMPGLVECFVPRSRRALHHIEPSLQGLTVGDVIPDWGPGDPTFEVLEILPPQHVVFWSERPRRPRRGLRGPPMRLTWAHQLTAARDDRTVLRLRLRLDLGHPAGPLPRYGGEAFDWLTVALLRRGLNERLRQA